MIDTVTPPREPESKSGMGIFGWIVAALIALLLWPVLPFLFLVYVALRLAGGGPSGMTSSGTNR